MGNKLALVIGLTGLLGACVLEHCSPTPAFAADTHIGPSSAYPPASVTGFASPAVSQDNIATTVCVDGWTKTIRPPASYTNRIKAQQMTAWGLPGKLGDYELDHFWSLEIGGDPRDPRNLWPQPYAGKYGARVKDQVEDKLHRMVCSGTMKLVDAQACIAADWVGCGVRIGAIKLAH